MATPSRFHRGAITAVHMDQCTVGDFGAASGDITAP